MINNSLCGKTALLVVATVGYVHLAIATLLSAKRRCPGDLIFAIFVADGDRHTANLVQEIGEKLGLNVAAFTPDDLSPAHKAEYLRCFVYYNAFEVSNVAKYVGIRHLLGKSCDRVVYADSDIYFTDDVCSYLSSLDASSAVVLTAHQNAPSPALEEREYLLHGWVNTGFSVFDNRNESCDDVLDWLIDRIGTQGYLAPQLGMSGDQPWVSGLPFIFPNKVRIDDHPGVNVAYWNLSTRDVTSAENDEYACDGEPLYFFHFSGFQVTASQKLSKHSDYTITPDSAINALCKEYRELLALVSEYFIDFVPGHMLPVSDKSLSARLQCGEDLNNIEIGSPHFREGVFSKIGGRLDSWLSVFN